MNITKSFDIDDKFGFEAETDWEIIYNYLVEGIRLGKFK